MATRKKVVATRKKKSSPKKVIEHDPLSMPDEEIEGEVIQSAQVEEKVKKADGEREMNDSSKVKSDDVVDLGCSLVISEVESCRNNLLEALQGGKALVLDGSEIQQIDGAGLQLLAAFAQEAEKLSVAFKWHGASQVLCDASRRLGLTEVLQLNAVCQAA